MGWITDIAKGILTELAKDVTASSVKVAAREGLSRLQGNQLKAAIEKTRLKDETEGGLSY